MEERVPLIGDGKKKTLVKRICNESQMVWDIAAPAMLTAVAQYSMKLVSCIFAGHIGEVELAAISIVQNAIEIFVNGLMLGMSSALETLSGQAVGAKKLEMLGIYMQKSWVISTITSLFLLPLYMYASPLLQLIGQDKHISETAGIYAKWAVLQLFAYAANFPIQKFFQAQSRVWVMTIISIVLLAIHIPLNWVLVTKLAYGVVGVAIAGDISLWLLVLAQLVYIVSGYFPEAWTGFSFSAFKSLAVFLKLSLASAVMLCLEMWYYTAILLMVGLLKNPEIAVDAQTVCADLQVWCWMIIFGFSVAVSVRVANELGAGNPKATTFSIMVTLLICTILGVIFTTFIVATSNEFPKLFTDKPDVRILASDLTYFLAASVFLNTTQLVLTGAAIGAGWQSLVAYVNVGCFYMIGIPMGALLGFKLELGVKGIWLGMLSGVVLQTVFLIAIFVRTNWNTEVARAKERIKTWDSSAARNLDA